MKQVLPLIAAVSFLLWAVPGHSAEEGPGRDYGFQPLEIYEFREGTRNLAVEDVNGDGLDDILFVNQKSARLEMIMRRPSSREDEEDILPPLKERFEDHGLVVDQVVTAFEVEDFNGDGRPDLLTLGYQIGLLLRLQQEDGSFGAARKLYLQALDETLDLDTGDFNEDGRLDIAVSRRGFLEILWNAGEASFSSRTKLPIATGDLQNLLVADFDGDEHLDLLFVFNAARLPLRLRRGSGQGTFGLAQPMDMPATRYCRAVPSAGGSAAMLGCVLRSNQTFNLYSVEAEKLVHFLERDEVIPQRLTLRGMGSKYEPAWTTSDFNGDGYDDFCVAAPELGQLHLYYGSDNGLVPEPERIDSLAGITNVELTTRGDIVVFSPGEKAVALHDRERLEEFPRIVSTPGTPVAMAAHPGGNFVVIIFQGTGKKTGLAVVPLEEKQSSGAGLREFPLDQKNVPEDISTFLLASGTTDLGLILHVPYAEPKMYRLSGDELQEVDVTHFRALATIDGRGDLAFPSTGRGEHILVADDKTVRLYEWRGDGYAARRQFAPPSESTKITALCGLEIGGLSKGFLLYDENSRDLLWYAEDEKEPRLTHLAGGIRETKGLVQLRSAGEDEATVLLLSRNEVLVLQNGAYFSRLLRRGEYTSIVEDAAFSRFEPVRLGAQGSSVIALVEHNNRSLELASYDEGKLDMEIVFEVFQDPGLMSSRGDQAIEPHDIASGDIDGDGLQDLVLLVHDNLIIYRGE